MRSGRTGRSFDPAGALTNTEIQGEPHEADAVSRLAPGLLRAAQRKPDTEPSPLSAVEVRLTELIERYCNEQTHWKAQSRDDIRGGLRQIAAVAGNPVAAQLSRPLLSQVQAILLKLPANLNTLPQFAGCLPPAPHADRDCGRALLQNSGLTVSSASPGNGGPPALVRLPPRNPTPMTARWRLAAPVVRRIVRDLNLADVL